MVMMTGKDGNCEARGSTEEFEGKTAASPVHAPAPMKRKAGGGVEYRAEGGAASARHDRPGRASGGGTKKWIAGAVRHPGAEKRAAAKAGESTHDYMEEHKGDSGTAGKRARLGLTLSAMSKKK